MNVKNISNMNLTVRFSNFTLKKKKKIYDKFEGFLSKLA